MSGSYPQKTGSALKGLIIRVMGGVSSEGEGRRIRPGVHLWTSQGGYSLAYQVEEIERYCRQNGLELLRIYEDKGLSGAVVDEEGLTVEREGLQEMLADLKGRNVSVVVVLNTSRLWRSEMAKVLIQRELKRHKVDVKAIEQPNYSIYAHDPNDILVNGMLELLDQYQRLEIALKLSRGRKKKAQQGGYAGVRLFEK